MSDDRTNIERPDDGPDAGTLRTPDDRFADLPGFPFQPHYIAGLEGYPGARVHYVDEGPRDAASVMLCLHGHPTWSYLFRRMIPIMAAAGHRVIAPDLPGFGRSDKPADEADYSFERLRALLLDFIDRLGLANVTLVMHDWGGTLGLTLPMERPETVTGLIVMNCCLPTGEGPLPSGVAGWRTYNQNTPDLNVPGLMAKANRILTFGECRAYGAPFPDAAHKAGVRALPRLIADQSDAPGAETARRARGFLSEAWDGVSQVVIGGRDPVIGVSAMRSLHACIRNTPPLVSLSHAGHFLPEWGDEFLESALASLVRQRKEKAADDTDTELGSA